MKLVMAIVNDEDSNAVLSELNKNKFSVTKLATTGGFLKAGNVTFIIGTDDEKVQEVIYSDSKRINMEKNSLSLAKTEATEIIYNKLKSIVAK